MATPFSTSRAYGAPNVGDHTTLTHALRSSSSVRPILFTETGRVAAADHVTSG
jgi:hypothetical protein